MTPTETKTIIRTYRQPMPLTILQRLDKKDKTAVKDCLDTYGNVIWALAKKYTSTIDEAETATAEIFTDVWRYARKGGNVLFHGRQFDSAYRLGSAGKKMFHCCHAAFLMSAESYPGNIIIAG